MVRRSRFGQAIAGVLVLAAVACSGAGDDDDDDAKARKPDTGVGAHQIAPEVHGCEELCSRLGDCAEALCNEDTQSTRYTGLGDLLADQCVSTCDQMTVDTRITPTQWACLFEKSCRQAIDYDDCHTGGAYYTCT